MIPNEIRARLDRVREHTRLLERLVSVTCGGETKVDETLVAILRVCQDEAKEVSGGLEDALQATLRERKRILGPDGGK